MKTLLAVACALFLSACSDDAKTPADATPAKPDVVKVDAQPAVDATVDAAPAVDATATDAAAAEAATGSDAAGE